MFKFTPIKSAAGLTNTEVNIYNNHVDALNTAVEDIAVEASSAVNLKQLEAIKDKYGAEIDRLGMNDILEKVEFEVLRECPALTDRLNHTNSRRVRLLNDASLQDTREWVLNVRCGVLPS